MRQRRARPIVGRVHRRGPGRPGGHERRDHVPGLRRARVRVAPGGRGRLRLNVAPDTAVSRVRR